MKNGILALALVAAQAEAPGQQPSDPYLELVREQAAGLQALVETDAVRELLAAVRVLPAIETRTVYRSADAGYMGETWTEAEHAALDEVEKARVEPLEVDTRTFYETFYGSPLASLRAFDLVARHGIDSFEDRRVLDFGFGSIGQLRLLAACGAEAHGAEVMPLLRAVYSGPDAQGPFGGLEGRRGSVALHFGRWPAEEELYEAVGTDLDLVISKNTVKRGYVRPPVPVAAGYRIDFGVEPDLFLGIILESLRPGGLVMFYNVGAKPPAEPERYSPPTDIACPWSVQELSDIGFEVLAHDVEDSETIRAFGHLLGWDELGDIDEEIFARYTILRRPL